MLEARALEIFPCGVILILYLSINSCGCRVANSPKLIFFFFLQAFVQMCNMNISH